MHTRELCPCYADLVVMDCRLFALDKTHLNIEAIAVVGNRIACLGTNQDIRQWIGNKTQILSAQGKTVLPGFIDSHTHFKEGGFSISRVSLRDAATPEEFTRRIRDYARQIPREEWILGGNWDHEVWPGSPLPAREWIDGCTPDQPVLISRCDGHVALANSRALRLAGIDRDTADPPGGRFERSPSGELTGLLKDEAIQIVQKAVPHPTVVQQTRAIKAALAEACRYGITGIHDNVREDDFAIYQKLYEQGELTCRVYCLMPIQQLKSLAAIGVRAGFGNDWIRLGGLKTLADGSLGASTALFFEPYNNAPGNSGLTGPATHPGGGMLDAFFEADHSGLQVCVHAIGDKANHLVLDMYETIASAAGGIKKDRRFRVEHAQHLHPDDIGRFASLGVVASMQPVHLADDGCWAEKRIGHDRCKTAYAFKSLLNRGASLAFGTDWPIAPLNPFLGIHAAVIRQTADGKHPDGWFADEKITLEEAIKAYTIGSAYAEFAEEARGSLRIGKLADIVVLDCDITAIPLEQLKEIKVLYTIVGGKIVYQADIP